VYRFAVEDEADIPSINSFNMYFAIGVNSITTPSCILIASYVSQGDVLNRFTFTLNEELSRDLLQALDYSDLFNLKNIQPHSYFLDYAGSMHIIAEKITNKDRIFIIRKSDASLPFDYTIDYLLKLIKRMRA